MTRFADSSQHNFLVESSRCRNIRTLFSALKFHNNMSHSIQTACLLDFRPVVMNLQAFSFVLESSWNVMAHGDARVGKWGGNCGMESVASTLHITSEHGVSSITTADAHTSAASNRLNWRPCRFKWTRPFRQKTKSGFRPCAVTFQTQSTGLRPTKHCV